MIRRTEGEGDRHGVSASLKSLEVLRFVAAVLVVFAHISVPGSDWMASFMGAHRFVGSIGVDVFFVLSGVVMGLVVTRIQGRGIRQAGWFLSARFFRIYPLYLLVTLATVGAEWLMGRGLPDPQSALCDLFLAPCLSGGQYPDPMVGVAWTLRYEVYFYVATSLAVLTGWRPMPLLLIGAVVWLKPSTLDYYADPICLEFLMGYLLALGLPWLKRHPLPEWGSLMLLLGSFSLFMLAGMGKDFPPDGRDLAVIPRMVIYHVDGSSWPRLVTWGMSAALLTLGFLGIESHVPRVAIKLGQITYSMYLLQHFFLPLSGKLAGHGWPLGWSILSVMAMLLLASHISFRYFENPVNSWWRQKVTAQR